MCGNAAGFSTVFRKEVKDESHNSHRALKWLHIAAGEFFISPYGGRDFVEPFEGFYSLVMATYKIRDWARYFENAESRKIKAASWVPVKNRHDGAGYRRVAALSNSVQVFCAWNLIIQVASRMPTRGVLHDEDGALTASDLAFRTGFPESIFKAAFTELVKSGVKWLELEEDTESEHESHPEVSGRAGRFPDAPGDSGVEQNRTEQNFSSPSDDAGDEELDPEKRKYPPDFESFWNAYPKKKKKGDAIKAWLKLKPRPPLKTLLAAIESQRKTEDWIKEGGQYIPHPASWLNGACWEDELKLDTRTVSGPKADPPPCPDWRQKLGAITNRKYDEWDEWSEIPFSERSRFKP